jgi:hypothetical protein
VIKLESISIMVGSAFNLSRKIEILKLWTPVIIQLTILQEEPKITFDEQKLHVQNVADLKLDVFTYPVRFAIDART